MSVSASPRSFATTAIGLRLGAFAPVFVAMIVIGSLGVALGVRGAIVAMDLDMAGAVSVEGIGGSVFRWLAVGSFLLTALGVLGMYEARRRP